LSKKNLKARNQSIEETRKFHERYLRAINNPLRRKILRTLKEGYKTIEDLKSKIGLNKENLIWHLAVLENASCVEKDSRQGTPIYKLTQEGRVIDYME
jgi:DNA-binding transcriptional ArsR family regulator